MKELFALPLFLALVSTAHAAPSASCDVTTLDAAGSVVAAVAEISSVGLVTEMRSLPITVKFLGEDDSGDATFHHRHGPTGPLTEESFLAATRYKYPEREMEGDEFSFQRVSEEDWQYIIDSQENPADGEKLKELWKGLDVAMVTVNDPRSFAARAYLVATDRDGNFYVYRGIVGGMTF